MLHPYSLKHFLIIFAIVVVSACSTVLPSSEGSTGKKQANTNQKSAQEHLKRPENGLSDPAFKKLKPEVLLYLEDISDAFYKKNQEFLLNQAELYYKQTYSKLYPTAEYLAMLYRIGPYSTEEGYGYQKMPRLDINSVKGIVYTGWDELGPVLEVRGKIYLEKGKTEPCRLILLWRLGDIKIRGFEP